MKKTINFSTQVVTQAFSIDLKFNWKRCQLMNLYKSFLKIRPNLDLFGNLFEKLIKRIMDM